METLIAIRDFATDFYNMDPDRVKLIPMAGSNRVYVRLFFAHTIVIGTYNENIRENEAFFYLSETLSTKGINVPKVIIVSEDRTMYLQDDCGQMDAYSLLVGAKKEEKSELLKEIIDGLVHLHVSSMEGIDFTRCYPSVSFDTKDVLHDLNYFEEYFLAKTGIIYDRNLLKQDFEHICKGVAHCHFITFMYRDFQSRNILVQDEGIAFIDFQGGRKGPGVYDIISLVYQAKLELSEQERTELISYYTGLIADKTVFSEVQLSEDINAVKVVRLLQVLGAYGLRGLVEQKPHFIASIDPAIENLKIFTSDKGFAENMPYLSSLLEQIIQNKSEILCLIRD